jgi:hypothetical protein
VNPVTDPLLFRKSGIAGNRTRDLWVCHTGNSWLNNYNHWWWQQISPLFNQRLPWEILPYLSWIIPPSFHFFAFCNNILLLQSKVINHAPNTKTGGPDPCIYVPQWQGDPVIPPGTGFSFRYLPLLARPWWRYSNHSPYVTVQIMKNIKFGAVCLTLSIISHELCLVWHCYLSPWGNSISIFNNMHSVTVYHSTLCLNV